VCLANPSLAPSRKGSRNEDKIYILATKLFHIHKPTILLYDPSYICGNNPCATNKNYTLDKKGTFFTSSSSFIFIKITQPAGCVNLLSPILLILGA
jgi:hypothetical protein